MKAGTNFQRILPFLLLTGIPLIFLLLFFYVPLASIFAYGLADERGRITLKYIWAVLSNNYYQGVLSFTLYQAFLSTLFALFLGLPGAYILSHFTFPGKKIVSGITTVPFVLPPILVVLGFVLFFGNSGVLNGFLMKLFGREEPVIRVLYSLKAIILAHGFYNFPICIKIVAAVWGNVSAHEIEAAGTLGAGRRRVFFTVTLPQILPGILSAAALIFLFCFLSFAVILVLGGGPQVTTLEVEIYRLAKVSLNLRDAGALALIGSVLSLCIMYLYTFLQNTVHSGYISGSVSKSRPIASMFRGWKGFFLFLYIALIILLVVSPVITVIMRSFQYRFGWGDQIRFGFRWYQELFSQNSLYGTTAFRAIRNTFINGMMTVLLSLGIGTLFAYVLNKQNLKFKRLIDTAVMLPLGVSPIILGLSYIKIIQALPIEIKNQWILISLAHTIIAYPFVIRSVSAVFRRIPQSYINAAATLGASPVKIFFTVYLPLLRPGLIAGAAFAFALSAGEMNAAIILSGEKSITIPIAIYRMIGSYNFFGACALGVILIIMCSGAFIFIDKIGGVRE